MHPSLRTKKIKGTDGLFECSVNMDIRIIWTYYDDEIIILLDVGLHDILQKY
jgi:mRNA-degrading endonuclease YafQ of YafQ-DinJ toxin-antitoxin module